MNQQRGFSLVEAMVVVAIIIILAGVGVPAMQDIITNARLKTATSDLFADILRARSEAIKRNMDVQVKPAAGGWSKGWTIPSPTVGAGNLQAHAELPYITVTGPDNLTYMSTGRLRSADQSTFSLEAKNGSARCITVDLGGRPNIQPKKC